MAWKGLHLSRPAHLGMERGSLVIDFRDDGEPKSFRVPVEDLGWIIADTPRITFSSSLLSRCSAEGVLILGVDDSHLPSWASLPWTKFHRHGEVLRLQLDANLPLYKRLWQEIVRRKITAQAKCLSLLGRTKAVHLAAMAGSVKSGDADNIEARAAQLYFKHLFPRRYFTRHADDFPNHLLNYGYAVLRAVIARNLCAMGFMPQIGIHHRSLANAYNLADDLIEPFRPLVDRLAVTLSSDREKEEVLDLADRRSLAALLECEVATSIGSTTLFHAVELTVESLKSALRDQDVSRLQFPEPRS
ncbi:MAG: type II CRISPR-associated endonuclease Cas1 [Verrucomicrobiota bacterium]